MFRHLYDLKMFPIKIKSSWACRAIVLEILQNYTF